MKNDLIAWIDVQIEKNNAMFVDGEEEHPEKSVPAQDNLILCKIKDALGEMTAVEYLRTIKEMCEDEEKCMQCNLLPAGNCHRYSVDFPTDPRRAVEIMKKWKEDDE